MAKMVYKWQLDDANLVELGKGVTLELPSTAQFLDFEYQNGAYCMWAEFDPSVTESKKMKFELFGTGQPISNDAVQWLKTIHLPHVGLVFHLYEMKVE